jgi:hypothetical protein
LFCGTGLSSAAVAEILVLRIGGQAVLATAHDFFPSSKWNAEVVGMLDTPVVPIAYASLAARRRAFSRFIRVERVSNLSAALDRAGCAGRAA